MAIRLASVGPQTERADTIGVAWLAVARRILTEGAESRYDGLPVREISLVTLVVDHPGPADEIIATHAEPERLAWMHANFTEHAAVAALGDADSIDFGTKGYGNLVELASLQQHVAGQLARPTRRLLMIIKSAHVYESERAYLRDILEGYR